MAVKYVPEPFRIKMVEPIKMLTPKEREQKIKAAKYNLFRIKQIYTSAPLCFTLFFRSIEYPGDEYAKTELL